MDVVLAELTEKVLAACNDTQRRISQSSGAEQSVLPSGAAEPTEQVLDASNGMKLRRGRRLRSAVSRAEQLADEETDVVAGAVGATRNNEMDSFIAPERKRSRMTDEHIMKKRSSPP